MGHQLLGRLPRSKEWKQVVRLLRGEADLETIAAATSRAAEKSMIDAAQDDCVRHTFWLLAQLPLAAREETFPKELSRRGVNVGAEPTLVDITTGVMAAIDRKIARSRNRSDYGEMAALCAVESIQAVIGRELNTFFDPTPANVRGAIAGFATAKQFTILARDFFSRLTKRHFAYFLSREISSHVGPGQRFATMAQHRDFESALEQHCREASRIIKEFSGQWFEKHKREDSIDPEAAGRFVHVAAKKIRDELQHRRGYALS